MSTISIDVRKKTIKELIDDEVPSGKYWLPSFQRQYVWDSDNIKELLDSIVLNYPIGATILWKPSAEIASEIDPTSSPIIDKAPSNTKERYFVIDGQQRMTSLLLLFNNWELLRGGEKIIADPIAFDPANSRFIRFKNRGINCSKIVKAFCQNDVDVLTELKNGTTKSDFERMRIIAHEILKYPVPQYVMETSGEDIDIFSKMAEAFVRINKEGIKIGNVELMLSFLAGTLNGELKSRVQKLYGSYEKKQALIQPIIRSVFSNFGLSQTQLAKPKQFKANIEKIKEISSDDMDRRLKTSEKSLRLLFELLEKELGIKNLRLVPTQTALIPLTTYFSKENLISIEELSQEEKGKIISWFLLVNFNGHYSSSVDTKLNKAIRIIQDSKKFPFTELLSEMKSRKTMDLDYVLEGLNKSALREANKALVFLLYVLLIKNGAENWGGKLIEKSDLTDLERHHIFPREYLQEALELDEVDDPGEVEKTVSNLGNITFILKDVNGSINATPPEDYLPRYIERAKLHFIPVDKRLWTKEAFENEEFQKARLKLVFEAAKKYFPDVFKD